MCLFFTIYFFVDFAIVGKCFDFFYLSIFTPFFPHDKKHTKPVMFYRVPFQMAEELRTWITESMEKEEKRRLADEAKEKRALAIANAPRRRSGRLIVSFLVRFLCMQVV